MHGRPIPHTLTNTKYYEYLTFSVSFLFAFSWPLIFIAICTSMNLLFLNCVCSFCTDFKNSYVINNNHFLLICVLVSILCYNSAYGIYYSVEKILIFCSHICHSFLWLVGFVLLRNICPPPALQNDSLKFSSIAFIIICIFKYLIHLNNTDTWFRSRVYLPISCPLIKFLCLDFVLLSLFPDIL